MTKTVRSPSSPTSIWEIEEFDGTITKAERASLKAHLTRTHQTFRAPYARFDVTKPITASYIGTVNNDGSGFLDDPSGNRRYRVIHIPAGQFTPGFEISDPE